MSQPSGTQLQVILSYVHFLHLCSNLLPVTSSKQVYIFKFESGFWNFQISCYSHLHADSLLQQIENENFAFL